MACASLVRGMQISTKSNPLPNELGPAVLRHTLRHYVRSVDERASKPLRQAFMKDYYVVFTSDCTAAYSQSQHNAALDNIDRFFGHVMKSDEVLAAWREFEVLPNGFK